MNTTLLQFDFDFSGPWGGELAAGLEGLAHDIAAEDGLIWKIWTENQAEGRAGGIYLFRDAASAERYRLKHSARLAGFGVDEIRSCSFDVNDRLSSITRSPA